MRSDDELDKETDKQMKSIAGVILVLILIFLMLFGVWFGITDLRSQRKSLLEATSTKEEVPIDKLKIKAEILRHNFPLEHPKYHVEKKDGAEYWFCDDEYCSMYLVISDDLQIMASGYPQMTECNKHLFVEEQ